MTDPGPRCDELVELLGDYLEGTLPPAAVDVLEGHLQVCRGCSAVLDQLQATAGLLAELPLAQAPDELPDDVRSALTAAFEELRGDARA